jgi:hypothetical protein
MGFSWVDRVTPVVELLPWTTADSAVGNHANLPYLRNRHLGLSGRRCWGG